MSEWVAPYFGRIPPLDIAVFTVASVLHPIGTTMTVAPRTGYVGLLMASLAAGCGGGRMPTSLHPPRISQRLEEADALVRSGRYSEARAVYAKVLTKDGAPTGADRALLGLERLALDPRNPESNARQAVACFDRLLEEYPESRLAAEAHIVRSLLGSVEGLQRDVRQHQHDLDRLRRDLRQEQQETVRLRQKRELLQQLDVELERRRQSQNSPTTAQSPQRSRESR